MLPKKKKKREESAAAHWCFKVCSPYRAIDIIALEDNCAIYFFLPIKVNVFQMFLSLLEKKSNFLVVFD
jgi:hypothetical protein